MYDPPKLMISNKLQTSIKSILKEYCREYVGSISDTIHMNAWFGSFHKQIQEHHCWPSKSTR